jgi:hypothetical protein
MPLLEPVLEVGSVLLHALQPVDEFTVKVLPNTVIVP